ncbi:alpha/beta fold hydrolase [Changchengzhania lutea]|uniref:alpha/beta fold hydrolase n=1 Tax=Changchengzhania lutea TaxID=2049305 RepID=UPI00115EDB30|nr:alpha/beta fold hydrolase [Changchengzhania lutea]
MKSYLLIIFTALLSLHTIAQSERPQTPQEPFDYTIEDVTFINAVADNIKLAGTLTIPNTNKKAPVAILISGSGPQNRNEDIANHQPFWVIADYLTNHGIAVLRYDDRGTEQSEGDFNTATSFDFATDVEAAIAYLKTRDDINSNQIGLIGHSEGGFIAPVVASKNKDVAFIVSLAGTGVTGENVILSQSRAIGKVSGAAEETLKFNDTLSKIVYHVIKTKKDVNTAQSRIKEQLQLYKTGLGTSPYTPFITDTLINQLANTAADKWLTTFIISDPAVYWSKTTCPVLALNGSKDLQVLPKLNLGGIESALKKVENKDITIKEIEGLNHLFQTSATGNPNEYGTLTETFSEEALEIIKDWILARF